MPEASKKPVYGREAVVRWTCRTFTWALSPRKQALEKCGQTCEAQSGFVAASLDGLTVDVSAAFAAWSPALAGAAEVASVKPRAAQDNTR